MSNKKKNNKRTNNNKKKKRSIPGGRFAINHFLLILHPVIDMFT